MVRQPPTTAQHPEEHRLQFFRCLSPLGNPPLMVPLIGLLASMTGCRPGTPELAVARRPGFPVQFHVETRSDPRPLQIHVARVDLTDPRVSLAVTSQPDPDGNGPAETVLIDPLDLVPTDDTVLAINTNPWAAIPGTDGRTPDRWYLNQPVNVCGWLQSDARMVSPPQPHFANCWIDARGRAQVADRGEPAADARWAVGGFGMLIADGQVIARDHGDLHPRTAIGTDADGTTLWLVVVDGRQPGYSEGMSLRELAELMQSLGCHHAANLDGGGSSIMIGRAADGGLTVLNRPSGLGRRPLPNVLAVRVAPSSR